MTSPPPGARAVFILSIAAATLSLLAILIIAVAEPYVRWNLNKEFSFLSPGGFPALIIGSFGLILGLAAIYRPRANTH